MEICCRTKQDKQGKGRGGSRRRGKSGRKRQGVRKIGDQPNQSNVGESDPSEDDGYYVLSTSDVSQTLYLL